MRPILVVTALEIEARGLARRLGLTVLDGRARPQPRSRGLALVCAGPGARRLAEVGDSWAASARQPSGLVISAGTCGALAPDLAEGALVVPHTVVDDRGTRHVTDRLDLAAAGTVLSVGSPVASAEAKARLWLETGALAVDMESSAILEWARRHDLRGAVVRAVSDTAAGGVPGALAGLVEPDGTVRTLTALRTMLARPAILPRALALRSGTLAALDTVAAALARLERRT